MPSLSKHYHADETACYSDNSGVALELDKASLKHCLPPVIIAGEGLRVKLDTGLRRKKISASRSVIRRVNSSWDRLRDRRPHRVT